MGEWVQQISIALVAGLIIWAASRIFYQRRLFGVVQNLFEHSNISDRNTVEILVANLGRQSEDEVRLELSTHFSYELAASTKSNVLIDENSVVHVGRLSPKQQIAIILVADGAERFRTDHINSLSSQSASGKVIKDMSEAHAADPLAGTLAVSFLLLLMAGGFFAGYTYRDEFSDAKSVASEEPPSQMPKEQQSFAVMCIDSLSNGERGKVGKNQLSNEDLRAIAANAFHVKSVYRQGNGVYAVVELDNPVDDEIEYAVSFKSPAADSTTDMGFTSKSYIYDIKMLTKGKRDVVVSNYLPEKFDPQIIWIEGRLEIPGGYWVNFTQKIGIGRDSAKKCEV